jgi:hypothetical protein
LNERRSAASERRLFYFCLFLFHVQKSIYIHLSPTWAGWADDATLQEGLAAINSAVDKKAAIAKWNELQAYCWNDYMPVAKIGTTYTFGVLSV